MQSAFRHQDSLSPLCNSCQYGRYALPTDLQFALSGALSPYSQSRYDTLSDAPHFTGMLSHVRSFKEVRQTGEGLPYAFSRRGAQARTARAAQSLHILPLRNPATSYADRQKIAGRRGSGPAYPAGARQSSPERRKSILLHVRLQDALSDHSAPDLDGDRWTDSSRSRGIRPDIAGMPRQGKPSGQA